MPLGLLAGLALPPTVAVDQSVEVRPAPPPGALELGIQGEVGQRYLQAMRAVRAGRLREALEQLHPARALAFQAWIAGPGGEARRQAYRQFVRLRYAEEQVQELTEIERQLERLGDRLSGEERVMLLHERALLLHNLFLLVRSFCGQADERLLGRALRAYEEVVGRQSPLRSVVQVGYASLLAERGDRRGAMAVFQQLRPEEREGERLDVAAAYYHLALGDRARAMARLEVAARRDGWDRPTAGQQGRSLRSSVYQMSDFDRLRSHPRFVALVAEPEELEALGR